jgi:transcriptional regulator GlxA family with amidase domain
MMADRADRHLCTRSIAVIGFEGFQILDVTGPLEVFSLASRLLLEQGRAKVEPYRVRFVARRAGPVASSSALCLLADGAWRDLAPVDTLLVSGGLGTRQALEDTELVAWLAEHAPLSQRYGSVCTGAMLLARAGLLDHRRVTTHWASLGELAQLAPSARVMPDAVFTRDGRLWTSAGVTAGMDMALAMVEEDWGRTIALEVAQQLLMHLKRGGGASQFSPSLQAQAVAADSSFRGLSDWIAGHLEEDLSVSQLAARMQMSPRHFARAFRAALGVTPAKFVEQHRFAVAQELLAAGEETIEHIAERCGFGSAETMRRVFVRRMGVGPSAYRRRIQRNAASPA